MNDRKRRLLAALADGNFHSGQVLAEQIGVSRTAVWKHLRSLGEAGLAFESIRGRGYRLKQSLELLDAEKIRASLTDEARALSLNLEVLFETVSTNQHLLDELDARSVHGRVVLSEYQAAGRGRGANNWLSAPAGGICLSLGWHFDASPDFLTALSLSAGVAAAEALRQVGCSWLRLKWPNDIVADDAKLGGILIESRGQIAGACDVVIGIGINVHLPEAMAGRIDQEATDLQRLLGPNVPSRNRLAALLISHLAAMLTIYEKHGFAPFAEQWKALDMSRGKTAVLTQASTELTGRVIDIDENGLLIMAIEGERKKFSSGELSLRIAP